MPFPTSERVIYKKNPLEQVICQLRFPPILRIESDAPAAFQERIRKEYPILEERPESVQLPEEMTQHIPPSVMKSFFSAGNRAYDFTSDDSLWTVSLTKDFLALTCRKYERWEDFKIHLNTAFDALIAIYDPNSFSRVGLRYRNVIRRSALGLENAEWAELLKPYVASELASPEPDLIGSIREIVSQVVIGLYDDLGQVRIQHGLVPDKEGESFYLIDSDFFTDQKTEIKHALTTLDTFNRQNRHLFRWCITDQLHQAMEPEQI